MDIPIEIKEELNDNSECSDSQTQKSKKVRLESKIDVKLENYLKFDRLESEFIIKNEFDDSEIKSECNGSDSNTEYYYCLTDSDIEEVENPSCPKPEEEVSYVDPDLIEVNEDPLDVSDLLKKEESSSPEPKRKKLTISDEEDNKCFFSMPLENSMTVRMPTVIETSDTIQNLTIGQNLVTIPISVLNDSYAVDPELITLTPVIVQNSETVKMSTVHKPRKILSKNAMVHQNSETLISKTQMSRESLVTKYFKAEPDSKFVILNESNIHRYYDMIKEKYTVDDDIVPNVCDHCYMTFRDKYLLVQHFNSLCYKRKIFCKYCNCSFSPIDAKIDKIFEHISMHHYDIS